MNMHADSNQTHDTFCFVLLCGTESPVPHCNISTGVVRTNSREDDLYGNSASADGVLVPGSAYA